MTPEERTKQKEKKAAENKKYRETHKDTIAQQRAIRVTCSCGKSICKRHLSEHMASKGHTQNTTQNM